MSIIQDIIIIIINCSDCSSQSLMSTFITIYMYNVHETIKEPHLPKHERGLDVTLQVIRCAGRVSANTRPHQLHWGDLGTVGATWHAHATQMCCMWKPCSATTCLHAIINREYYTRKKNRQVLGSCCNSGS